MRIPFLRTTFPFVGLLSPVITFTRVDLPAPFGPIKVVISPRSNLSEMLSKTSRSPNETVIDCSSTRVVIKEAVLNRLCKRCNVII